MTRWELLSKPELKELTSLRDKADIVIKYDICSVFLREDISMFVGYDKDGKLTDMFAGYVDNTRPDERYRLYIHEGEKVDLSCLANINFARELEVS